MAVAQLKEKEVNLSDILPDLHTRYAYVMANKNEHRGKVFDENGNPRPEQEYPPFLNVILTSPIIWDGKPDPFTGKPRNKGTHQIRYYDGCTTLFVDDQPKEKATIDQLLESTRQVNIIFGYCFVFGYDSMLKLYMDWTSYNESSPYRVPTKAVKFKNVDSEKAREIEEQELELQDKATELAKSATEKKMRIHGKYLGVPFEDAVTSYPLSEKAIRTEYRKLAKSNPKRFVETYNNKTIEINNWVIEALDHGEISTTKLPNMATWRDGAVIMDLEGLKSRDLIVQKLVEYTIMEEGADFLAQLKSLYS